MTNRGGAESRGSANKIVVPQAAAADSGIGGFDFAAVLSIADAIPVMIAYLDRRHRYTFVNRALADWFERPRAQILGRTVRELLGEEAYASRAPLIEAAFAGERQWFAIDFDHPTRGALAVQSEYIPQLGADGVVRGVLMLVEDITEKRIAGRALSESEARFRRIADSAPVPMWVTRLDHSRDFVNDAYVELMGVSREASRSHNWVERIHPDDRQRMMDETRAGEESGSTFTIDARFRLASGDYRWMRAVTQPRRDSDGEPVGYIGIAVDVTVTKEAELELRRLVDARTEELSASEARLRAIFDTVMEIIVLTKPDGTIVQMNRTKAEWREPNPEAAVGAKLWDSPTVLAFPEHRALVREAVAVAARGETFEQEVKLEREGIANVFLDVTLRPVRGAKGEIAFLLFEARDITELKAAQEQLRQSQKMEALGQLTGGIAHDFNNLLTVVVGGLDLISKNVDDAKLKRYADNALAAAERGARLTAQLLAFSRVQKLEVRPTLVAPLIENMRALLHNVLGPGIAKNFDLHEHQTPVMADPTQLELAVLNLAINARDAMPNGGTLVFRTRKVRVADDAEMDDGDYVELAIRDDGAGMPPAVVARAFEPFFTTKEVGKGTGLGLSMVYGVARQSGGTARIVSAPGEGTTVKLYFRHADREVEASTVASPNGGVLEGERGMFSVLVIDDDPAVRAFIVSSLIDHGHQVREASEGASGLALYRAERPDVVVLDYIMPGVSGAEVAREILAEAPDQVILFVSGFSRTEAIVAVAPDAPLLTKPFRAEALDAAVREAVSKRRCRAI